MEIKQQLLFSALCDLQPSNFSIPDSSGAVVSGCQCSCFSELHLPLKPLTDSEVHSPLAGTTGLTDSRKEIFLKNWATVVQILCTGNRLCLENTLPPSYVETRSKLHPWSAPSSRLNHPAHYSQAQGHLWKDLLFTHQKYQVFTQCGAVFHRINRLSWKGF